MCPQNEGLVAERLGRGLQNLVQRFESARDLTKSCPKIWMAFFVFATFRQFLHYCLTYFKKNQILKDEMNKEYKKILTNLNKSKTEEDVKNAYAKHFKINYDTSDRHDLYTPQVLFEFKYDKNMLNLKVRTYSFEQRRRKSRFQFREQLSKS